MSSWVRSFQIIGLTVGIVAAAQLSAYAGRSVLYPDNSSLFSVAYSLKQDLKLKDELGRPITLTQGGYLLTAEEDLNHLSPNDLAARRISKLEIGYDENNQRSYVGLMNDGGLFAIGERRVRFGLPTKTQIDSTGYPERIDGLSSTAEETGQGISMRLALTSPGSWRHYSDDSAQSCGIGVTTFPGAQAIHSEGDSRSDGYTITLGDGARLSFELSYDAGSSMYGPCLAMQ